MILILDLISTIIKPFKAEDIRQCVSAWKAPAGTATIPESKDTSLIGATMEYIIGNRFKLLSGLFHQVGHIKEYDQLLEQKIKADPKLKVVVCGLLDIDETRVNDQNILSTFLYQKVSRSVITKLRSISTKIIDGVEAVPKKMLTFFEGHL